MSGHAPYENMYVLSMNYLHSKRVSSFFFLHIKQSDQGTL